MDRPSLDQRFGDTGHRLPTTALHRHWAQQDGTDRQSLDQRFGSNDHRPSVSEPRHHKAIIESQDNGAGLQLPMTATASFGQQTMQLPVAATQDCNGHQASSSRGTETTANVSCWTSKELHLSINGSAGAQLRNTDKASRTEMESRTANHDIQASAHSRIGSTESRLATLRGQLDFNEVDDFASSNVDLLRQRSAPPSATASSESSAGHRIYASPGGPKVVDVNLQVDLDSSNVEEDTGTCRTDPQHRFSPMVVVQEFRWVSRNYRATVRSSAVLPYIGNWCTVGRSV